MIANTGLKHQVVYIPSGSMNYFFLCINNNKIYFHFWQIKEHCSVLCGQQCRPRLPDGKETVMAQCGYN